MKSNAERASRETRLAIEIVTVLLPGFAEPSGSEVRRLAHEHAARVCQDEDPDTIFKGLLTLTILVLQKLAEQRGATPKTMLREMGKILQEVSRDLPA